MPDSADRSDPQEVVARARGAEPPPGTQVVPGFDAVAFKASRGFEDIYELIVEPSLLIFNVPGTDITQGESCHDVIMFVERHDGIIVLDRSGDLWNPAFRSIIKDQDKRWHMGPMKSARISRRWTLLRESREQLRHPVGMDDVGAIQRRIVRALECCREAPTPDPVASPRSLPSCLSFSSVPDVARCLHEPLAALGQLSAPPVPQGCDSIPLPHARDSLPPIVP